MAHRGSRALRARSSPAAASRSWRSGTAAFLPATYYFRRRGIVVITSENFDGEWIAGIIERFGYGTARGSTSRGGRKALLQLTRDMAAGKPAGFTLDGPRGPGARRAARRGVAGEGDRQSRAAVPSRSRAGTGRCDSWDRTQIPKPFATVAIVVGEPFDVPGGGDDAAIESARTLLEARLHALETRAREIL